MCPWTGSDHRPGPGRTRRVLGALSIALLVLAFPGPAAPGPAASGSAASGSAARTWTPLVERLVADGLDRAYVEDLYGRAGLQFSPEIMAQKLRALLNARRAAAAPEQAGPAQVMGRYLNPVLIAGAFIFFLEHDRDFQIIRGRYQVPGELLSALFLVETRLGGQLGEEMAMATLSSMAMARDFAVLEPALDAGELSPKTEAWLARRMAQKADWAYAELRALILYARENGFDPLTIPGSIFGAIGLCKFVPTSALVYGVDGDGDGRVDLFGPTDALHSAANFLHRHGWRRGLGRRDQLEVLLRYNPSESYALTIMTVAGRIRRTGQLFGNESSSRPW